jgi:putative FmdB family regulatory protein
MPTYDYVCTACGHRFEQVQSIKAEPLKECPKCGGAVQREIGAGGGFIFKGSGFYITDYTRSKDYKEKAKSEAIGGASASAKSEGGTPASTPAASPPPTPSAGTGSSAP